jgi:hypothetical protein
LQEFRARLLKWRDLRNWENFGGDFDGLRRRKVPGFVWRWYGPKRNTVVAAVNLEKRDSVTDEEQ